MATDTLVMNLDGPFGLTLFEITLSSRMMLGVVLTMIFVEIIFFFGFSWHLIWSGEGKREGHWFLIWSEREGHWFLIWSERKESDICCLYCVVEGVASTGWLWY